MVNIGAFNERICVLKFIKAENTIWRWMQITEIWAKPERKSGKSLFSSLGLGADSFKFIIRKRPISLHHAVLWRGHHYTITDIVDLNDGTLEITAAKTKLTDCVYVYTPVTKNERNNPVYGVPHTVSFPGILTEIYYKYARDERAYNDVSMLLVTPKPIALRTGGIVRTEQASFTVHAVHAVDLYKNEYEIAQRRDA